jgi:hypothetical protein
MPYEPKDAENTGYFWLSRLIFPAIDQNEANSLEKEQTITKFSVGTRSYRSHSPTEGRTVKLV